MTRRFPGWWVVGSVFVLLMTNAGLGFYGLAVYLDALTDEADLSTTMVSLATSMFFLISAVTGRFVAPVIERHDVRLVVAAGGVVSAASLLAVGWIDGPVGLLAVYAVFSVGFALSGLVPATTLVTRWFHARRSVALSIASTGLSVGGLTLTRLASSLIDDRGLDDATPVLALLYAVLCGLALLTMWPDPARRGWRPDGAPADPTAATAAAPATAAASSSATGANGVGGHSIGYDTAIATPFFRVIAAGFVCAMGAQVGAITQIAKLGTERIDRPAGAAAVSALAGASVVARLIGGVVASRVAMMPFISVLTGIQAVSLALFAFVDSRATLLAVAVVFGATVGNLLMLQPLVVAEAFGVGAYPRIFALQQMIVTCGIAGGPLLLGVLRDLSGYRTSYLAAAAVSVLGMVIFSRSPTARPTPATVVDRAGA